MYQNFHYRPDDKMITLIADDYQLIQVMTRFGLRLGFGDSTVREVCAEAGVDCATFLTVVNFVIEGYTDAQNIDNVSLPSLLQYLRQSHIYFLEYCLPAIRRKLLDGIQFRTTDVSFLILRFFDEYFAEVRTHMEYEEATVFKHVRALLAGDRDDEFRLTTYSDHHQQVTDKLRELKSIIIKYSPDTADVNLLNAALYDLYRAERELENHCAVEDLIFVPAVMRLQSVLEAESAQNPSL